MEISRKSGPSRRAFQDYST